MKTKSQKFVAVLVAVAVIVLLVFSSSAQSFIVSLAVQRDKVLVGEDLLFNFEASIDEKDGLLDVRYFNFSVEGPSKINCAFTPEGFFVAPCQGVKIRRVSIPKYQPCVNPSYGSNCGFLPGKFIYNIRVDTSSFRVGDYRASVFAQLADRVVETTRSSFSVLRKDPVSCSVRATGGVVLFDGENIRGLNNRVSLFVGTNSSVGGQGSLILQGEKLRFSYSFRVLRTVLEKNKIIFVTSGRISSDVKENFSENALIEYDKEMGIVSVDGERVDVRNMKVFFDRC